MPDKAILITGVNGMIGHALARRLVSEGRAVVGIDRVAPAESELGCPVVVGELSDPHRLHAAIRQHAVDRIAHCGAASGPMVLRDNPFQLLETNVHGTLHVLEAARLTGVRRIVYMSSISAYGAQPPERPIVETAALLADAPYGVSKLCGEAMLRAYGATYGLEVVALRVSSVYGPRRTTDCLIRLMIENGLAGRPTRLAFGAGWRRQYVNVADVAAALALALECGGLSQLAYNISGGVNPTLEEVAAAVAAAVPGASAVFGSAAHPYDVPVGPLDIAAARRELGYAPQVPLADGIAAYAAWLGR